MDYITILRIAGTVASFVTFVGIMIWACQRRNAQAFKEASLLPFEEDGEAS